MDNSIPAFEGSLINIFFFDTILIDLNCLTFFGGLVTALFIGALAANILRRAYWKILVRRK
jgi:hypothetical protein